MPSKKLIGRLALTLVLGLAVQPLMAVGLPLGGVGLQPNGLLPGGVPQQRLQISPTDAARIAQQRNGGGRVLSVDPGDGGYRVKLLKNGDVRIVFVPGN